MNKVHLAKPNGRGGFLPLCDAAAWEALTRLERLNECWECASINGTETADGEHRQIVAQWMVGNITQHDAERMAAN